MRTGNVAAVTFNPTPTRSDGAGEINTKNGVDRRRSTRHGAAEWVAPSEYHKEQEGLPIVGCNKGGQEAKKGSVAGWLEGVADVTGRGPTG